MRMEVLMKTKSKELNKIWNNLEDIFLNYSGLTSRVEKNLSKIGVTVVRGGKHAKLFFSNLEQLVLLSLYFLLIIMTEE